MRRAIAHRLLQHRSGRSRSSRRDPAVPPEPSQQSISVTTALRSTTRVAAVSRALGPAQAPGSAAVPMPPPGTTAARIVAMYQRECTTPAIMAATGCSKQNVYATLARYRIETKRATRRPIRSQERELVLGFLRDRWEDPAETIPSLQRQLFNQLQVTISTTELYRLAGEARLPDRRRQIATEQQRQEAGTRLALAIALAGMTKRDVARQLGIPEAYIPRITKRAGGYDDVARFAAPCHVSADWLWMGADPAPFWATWDPRADLHREFLQPLAKLRTALKHAGITARRIAKAQVLTTDRAISVLGGRLYPLDAARRRLWSLVSPAAVREYEADELLRAAWLSPTQSLESITAAYGAAAGCAPDRDQTSERARLLHLPPRHRTPLRGKAANRAVQDRLNDALQQRQTDIEHVAQATRLPVDTVAQPVQRSDAADLIFRCARVLGVDPTWIWSGSGVKPPWLRKLAPR